MNALGTSPERFKRAFLESLRTVRTYNGDDIAVLLSGGIDSNVALLGLLELGVKPVAYSFTLDDRESTDFRLARANADALGVRFVPIILPTDLWTLMRDTTWLVRSIGARKKTAVECGWPMMYAMQEITQANVVTGIGADGNFGLSKKVMMHYAKSQAKFDAYRTDYYTDWYLRNHGQTRTIGTLARHFGRKAHFPYFDKGCWSSFIGLSWDALNKPKEKMPLRLAFPKTSELQVKRHTNLQLGDSGIAEHFAKLIDSPLNTKGHKSVVGVYNSIAEGA